ncbi:nucleoside kinase [Hominifimenecus sp. rT4P-3]|uniref:uridine kinase family protein n=1 Tax=Hominifimenecus sp. rT4P-3 TaxID=3242979 RepID=UPI003DA47344
MIEIQVAGKSVEIAEGTTYRELARQFQPQYENDIVLVTVNGKLQELHKTLEKPCSIEFVTTAHTAGIRSYERSLVLLMNKAIYDVVPLADMQKVTVKFSVTHGLYVEAKGAFPVDQEFLDRVRARMDELIREDIPIRKNSIHVDDAVAFFRKVKMYDKERLFRYRRSSHVNIYHIDGFADYHYGYMVPSTGYLKYYELKLYREGFVLLFPTFQDPKIVPPFEPQEKLFDTLQKASRWSEQLHVDTVGAVNDMISSGKIQELVLIAEARQEKEISEIASMIAGQPHVKFVMIAGPSSSGKTSFSHRLSIQLRAHGLTPHPIGLDDYFVDRDRTPRDENGDYDFEALECVDIKQFNEDMTALLSGQKVEMPTFNFKQGRREYKGNYLQLGSHDILVIEGIHGLNDALSYSLPKESKFKIYISALTQLNIDEHNRIPTTDGRLIRRMIRDARTRGSSAADTIARWPSVRRGEERNIFPYQETADVMFNSALIYEFSVLKSYAEPLLFGIPVDSPQYQEAKRLLKFFDYFLAVDSTAIPNNSLMKEFIGGSCFQV